MQPKRRLQAALDAKREARKPFKNDGPVGLWSINTEADCEWRGRIYIATEYGHIGELKEEMNLAQDMQQLLYDFHGLSGLFYSKRPCEYTSSGQCLECDYAIRHFFGI